METEMEMGEKTEVKQDKETEGREMEKKKVEKVDGNRCVSVRQVAANGAMSVAAKPRCAERA